MGINRALNRQNIKTFIIVFIAMFAMATCTIVLYDSHEEDGTIPVK